MASLYIFLLLITSTDANGMSVTSGATAPAPPNLLMLKTWLMNRISVIGKKMKLKISEK